MTNKLVNIAIALLNCLILFSCGPNTAEETVPSRKSFAEFTKEWNRITPGGGTICSTGTEYAFFLHPGNPSKVMIYFDGGGACWNYENCNPRLETVTHTPYVTDSIDNPGLHNAGITGASWQGLFDLKNDMNPVKDYTILMLPYCSADTHLGNTETSYYSEENDTLSIFHKGYQNASTALNWLDQYLGDPETIIVTGVSAGSIASPVYASIIASRYKNSRVVQLGDASGGYQSDEIEDLFALWGASEILDIAFPKRDTTMENIHENFYLWALEENDNLSLSQYNAAFDRVQAFFLEQLGSDRSIDQTILYNQQLIKEQIPEFHYFIDSGEHHGLIIRDQFYTTAVKGQTFYQWFSSMLNDESVPDLVCESCYDE